MNRIVCNTGPLIALGILDKLEILNLLFEEVFVPDAVQTEIIAGGIKLYGRDSFLRAKWIRIVTPKQNDLLLSALLDDGEAAVISLARELGISLVLIDERKARKVARDIYALQAIGTARILIEARHKKLLPEIASSFEKLRQEGYWISDDIVQASLRAVGEL